MQARDAEEQTSTVVDPHKESLPPNSERSREISKESSAKLRLRVKRHGESSSCEVALSKPKDNRPAHHAHSSLSVYMASVFVVLILIVGFVGIWRYLGSYAVALHMERH